MVMRQLSIEGAKQVVVQAVGFDPRRYQLEGPEVLAALVRRAVSFQSPCSARSLARSVTDSLRGLVATEEFDSRIDSIVDELLSYGDLIEVERMAGSGQVVYPAPPTFVVLGSGRILLLGVCPESVEWLPPSLSGSLTYRGHVRSLASSIGAKAQTLLKEAGYFEVPYALWLQSPKPATPDQTFAKYVGLLAGSGLSSEPTGITILDPSEPVHYYKRRWKAAAGDGVFVARRAQRYGAPLWSFIKLQSGRLISLVDLPVTGNTWRGCDEAWWLQAAIDARNNRPQYARMTPVPNRTDICVSFASPVPRWVQRQLDVIGEPVTQPGALFSYNIPVGDLSFVEKFLAQHLWIDIMQAKGDCG